MKEIPNDRVHIKTLIREINRQRLVMLAQLQLTSKIITSQSGRFQDYGRLFESTPIAWFRYRD